MVKEAEASLTRGMNMDGHGPTKTAVLRTIAEMQRGAGNHAGAVRLLDKALAMGSRESLTELHFLRGALGRI